MGQYRFHRYNMYSVDMPQIVHGRYMKMCMDYI